MQGVRLEVYMSQFKTHEDLYQFEWLLGKAARMGIKGGTAVKTMAGFGRDHVRAKSFQHLTANASVIVQFIVSSDDAAKLLQMLKDEQLNVFCTQSAVEFESL